MRLRNQSIKLSPELSELTSPFTQPSILLNLILKTKYQGRTHVVPAEERNTISTLYPCEFNQNLHLRGFAPEQTAK